ncbi:variant erythrocyte surface antigen-1 alpha subunit [Babesia bovis T2Bo]|uniref:Variant erythrocyte surface antigen-1, alpha subunit n=1 Tax=Babesia bovis TaxID=5865 RepID=A7AVQ6_BABBO|nr:variant erythrocyte surface antigen-1 alpha subunit [Babesia bovis T2Bo]EDO05882.1 variant erythrocyte surface antigen-1 alpha subunit [Babesia bovis T2Bo]|eukprot:XP_001609450.1 variant erythrocyte surface antigen-1, alpha subunit [Babesia bovis T2Bo]
MAVKSTFTPKASLTEAPTNLKEAIDWVLRVTGKDGKALNKDKGECICGLAAAVTDLLQSVQLEYNGYQGESNGTDPKKGPPKGNVTERLNELFSLVQGLGGTAVVRTYIDQLAQVLSALVGWSKIETCWTRSGECKVGGKGNQHGTKPECTYLQDVKPDNKCDSCGCMKWNVPEADDNKNGHHLGRRCKRGNGYTCGAENFGRDYNALEGYRSAYPSSAINIRKSFLKSDKIENPPSWNNLKCSPTGSTINSTTITQRRHQCARILLGSVCLIWSGITYMYWTGKYADSSPRWNNHILDGSGLDDGTLSQWLQALGFPREMLNNSGPQNRLDKVIWDGIMDKLYLGFPETGKWSADSVHGYDNEDNTFRNPAGMNYAGYIHTVDRGAFCSNATVFKNGEGSSTSEENINKCGALYKLYILSCAYFTGLQNKAPPKAENTTPKTIREILYWLSALPYSQAYKKILEHSKEVLKKVAPDKDGTQTLSFLQTGRWHPITVHEFNLFAHFQAVTQYCPLVLIGIQGGIHSTDNTKEPAIHSLYANSHFSFTYPEVPIQAYNQVVHYIRALFYQLYFLRKQCAVKVTYGGKWRECRYGDGVVSKGVISWMCLGCDPMEHDRKKRVGKVNGELGKVVAQGKDSVPGALKTLLEKIGEVVVQLGNAQEALEGKKPEAILGVKAALDSAKGKLEGVNSGLAGKLGEAKTKLGELTNGGGNGILGELAGDRGLEKATKINRKGIVEYDPGKNKISEAINKVREVLKLMKEGVEKQKTEDRKDIVDETKFVVGEISGLSLTDNKIESVLKQVISHEYITLLNAINNLLSICNSPKCHSCDQHSTKCGQPSNPTVCPACLQPTTTGVPSPLQAFLEDRLPGFSCDVVRNDGKDDPTYPPAASHLGHCNGSGQCCPLPMGFRNKFQEGITHTGQRLYGILYFFSNENMMQSCVYTLVRVTAALSATTPQVLGDVFGFFRGGIGNPLKGKNKKDKEVPCGHQGDPSKKGEDQYFCGWCASGLRDEVQKIEWVFNGTEAGGHYMDKVGTALIDIKGSDSTATTTAYSSTDTANTSLSRLTKNCQYLSPLTGELYTAVSATFGNTYLSWVLYLSDALHSGLESLSEAFQQIECRGCKGQCDPNKCKKGSHGARSDGQCGCQSIVSCTGVLPVLYRHGFSYGNPFNLEGYQQKDGNKNEDGQFDITKASSTRKCHEFLDSLSAVIDKNKQEGASQQQDQEQHPLTNLLSQVGKLQYDIRLPWIFVLTLAWLVAVLCLAFGAIWPLDWTHMRSHWLRGGEHQWQCMWYKVMTGRKGMELVEYFGKT